MVAIAMRYLENRDDAEDITQDALLKLWAMREMLRESEVDRLAFMVLKHLCINELKKREYKKSNNVVSIDSIDVALDPDNPQEIEERERQLMMAVDKLPSKQRQLLHMRYIKGKDVHTIAQITGSSEGSIKMALSRVRNKIYKLMTAVVAIVICIGLFVFSVGDAEEAPVEAHLAPKESHKTELAQNNDDTAAVNETEDANIVALNTHDVKHKAQSSQRSNATDDRRTEMPQPGDAIVKTEEATEHNESPMPTVTQDESVAPDRDMMLAILESSSPESVYASQSQLPEADISNRDRLRKKTLAIITLNE